MSDVYGLMELELKSLVNIHLSKRGAGGVVKSKVKDMIISSTSVDGFIGQFELRSTLIAAVQNKKWDLI